MQDKNLHIAFITPEYPSNRFKNSVGGIGTFTYNLAKELASKEYDVSVFIHSQARHELFVEKGVSIYRVKKHTTPGLTWYTNRRYFNKYVNNVIKNKSITVIEAPEWTGFTAFMKFLCPFIIRLHGSDTYFCHLENRAVKKKNYFFEKRALTGADKIIGVSKFVAEKTSDLFKINTKIEIIYNSVNENDFLPDHSNIKQKSLLYFGTLVRKKGVLEIANVFNLLVEKDPEITLILLGKDNLDIFTHQSTLKLFRSKLSVKALQNLKHISFVPYNEVKQYIANAEIILLPSYAEAFPMSWLEAMAMEKKIISSNIGWANELMIDENTGFMITPADHELFFDKVIYLLEDKKNNFGENARIRIIKFFNKRDNLVVNLNMYKKTVNDSNLL